MSDVFPDTDLLPTPARRAAKPRKAPAEPQAQDVLATFDAADWRYLSEQAYEHKQYCQRVDFGRDDDKRRTGAWARWWDFCLKQVERLEREDR